MYYHTAMSKQECYKQKKYRNCQKLLLTAQTNDVNYTLYT